MRNLALRTVTGVSLVALFAGSIFLGPIPFLVIILLVYLLSILELFRMLSVGNRVQGTTLALAGASLIGAVYAGLFLHSSPLWLILTALLWIAASLWPGSRAATHLTMFWLAIPYASFLALGWISGNGSYQSLLPVSVIALVWINDTFAYVTGSLLGRHPMTPKLSPGKTWEGFAGGILFTLAAGWGVWKLSGTYSPGLWLTIASITSLLGLAGDLFESWLKRRKEMKDTGTLLPGHGGILDRFDSLLFAAPAVLLLFIIINQFQ